MTPIMRWSICNIDFLREGPVVAVMLLAAILVTLVSPFQPAVLAQTTTASLTGTVFDASGAVVADAGVSLKNQASGDLRTTTSNGEAISASLLSRLALTRSSWKRRF